MIRASLRLLVGPEAERLRLRAIHLDANRRYNASLLAPFKVKARAGKQSLEYRSKVVIAADGATSVLARTLNKNRRPDNTIAVALRGYVETDVELEPTIDLVFLKEVQPGYAWFFPMGKRLANIGVGVRSDVYKKQHCSLFELLELYCNQPEMRQRLGTHNIMHIRSWQVPLCLVSQKRVFDGAVLIGDAGGFVDPLTGAGIYSAIVTGKLAAEACISAIRKNDVSTRGLAVFDEYQFRNPVLSYLSVERLFINKCSSPLFASLTLTQLLLSLSNYIIITWNMSRFVHR